ncbi:response regulator transcription factor [Membranicola marinus]|uniref:Phosphate regulon transcriptional regulatory protein PhoB n=1 Tax=Membranihabitans marinus TaxID=1227546 RepID=A0A953HN50_9BACT|nr:response regulator transcription factor [Membranihabitans marinus]
MYTPRILIVDDEEDILEFISYNLRKNDYEVFTASNGKDALKLAHRERPDLIILDIMMPEMDGIEVCKRLRNEEQFQETIIAFLTARHEDFVHTNALDVGGDDFITKPIKPSVLLSRIRALLRRSTHLKAQREKPVVLKADDLTLDEGQFMVTQDGRQIELPRKEFQILALLMSQPGHVFSRKKIFREVWGSDVIVGNRTIDVHIRKLREKIGDSYIKTVKGVGYKLDPK